MSEGREMEKKVASRLSTGSSAGKSLDKRDNGCSNGNGGNRFPKRRGEPVQWSKANNDPGQQRKFTPQKTKAFDKRPRGRKDWTGRRDEVTHVHRAEFGSALPQGPKKINLNHLINFTMAPRDDSSRGGRHSMWRGRNKWGIKHPKYNKEQFLQANCQFIVKATGDYTVQSVDPDKLVDWDLIEQVRIFSHEVPSCPICLYPPAAAKITRCGHVYCWPCILHYLALGDKSWRKCPICDEAVYTKDLKRMIWNVLLSRRLSTSLRKSEVPGVKKTTAEATSLLQDLELVGKDKKEDNDIIIQENLASNPSIVYASAFSDEEADPEAEDSQPKSPAFVIEEPEEALPRRSSSNSHTDEDDEAANHSSTPKMKEEGRESDDVEKMPDVKMSTTSPSRSYYFYQAEDGQHLYMHSINIRCLIKEYRSLDKCPPTVQARIVAIEHMSIDPTLRRRLNFLQHLPVTCEFATCELELKSPLLSKSTLQSFASEILKRKKNCDRKARDEKRRERKIQAEENKKLGNYPGPRFSIQSATHFPSYSTDAANSLPDTPSTQPSESPVASSVGSPVGSSFDEEMIFGPISGGSASSSAIAIQHQQSEIAASPPSVVAGSWKSTGSSDTEHSAAFPSFAQMLRDGKANPQAWPKVTHPSSSSSSKTQPKGSQIRSKVKIAGPDGSDESEIEDYVPVPQYREAFGDAIQAALDKAAVEVTVKKTDPENPSPNKKGKKGRKKQQLLFSTAGPRFK